MAIQNNNVVKRNTRLASMIRELFIHRWVAEAMALKKKVGFYIYQYGYSVSGSIWRHMKAHEGICGWLKEKWEKQWQLEMMQVERIKCWASNKWIFRFSVRQGGCLRCLETWVPIHFSIFYPGESSSGYSVIQNSHSFRRFAKTQNSRARTQELELLTTRNGYAI